ncbi:MAG: carboxypeptidase regulatory-like domain-containing protein [Acidobacteria bacterium]|nr:carboxypeptidase regulatory-like domain-containing protein [Acidobacteriota bacterium]
MKVRSEQVFAAALVIAVLLHGGAAATLAQATSHALRGVVKDQHGGLIVGARAVLTNERGDKREAVADSQGQFHFDRLAAGVYTLKVSSVGFGDHEQQFEAGGSPAQSRVEVVLLPTISESVVVGDDVRLPLDPEQASGTKVLTERELQALPDDPDQLRERLQQLSISAGSAPGEATVTVDGFLSDGRLPSKSSIREVRINPNLFSAEYDRPPFRGGRIEILTKPGASTFGGSAFFNFNDSALNAREAFAPVRTPSKTLRYGGQFGGPIIPRRAGFFLDFEGRDIGETETVNTVILDADRRPLTFSASVRTPTQLLVGSARADWQATQAHALVFRYEVSRNRLDNQGVGGFNLPERALDHTLTEHGFQFTETAVVSPSTFNELRVGLTRQRLTQRAVSGERAVSVFGAFESGGAATQEVTRDTRRLEITDYLSTTTGKHSLKFGGQVFQRRFQDRRFDNQNGTFVFGGATAPELGPGGEVISGPGGTPSLVRISGLEQYRRTLLGLPGGVPTRFAVTLGDSDVTVSQWLLAGFVQDEWRPRENLSVSLGLRYEGQTTPYDAASLAPRLGVAYTPDKRQRWVLRARAGLFYDRVGDALTFEARRLDGRQLRQLIINSPSFDDPLAGAAASAAVPNTRRLEESLRPPASLQVRVEVARELPGGWRVDVNHSWTSGWSVLRSRNVNAPLVAPGDDPLQAPRPFGVAENILQFESSGRIRGRVLYVGVNQSANQYFNVFSGYLHFSFRTDADTPFSLPQSSYDLSGEWARPFWLARHRFFLTNIINFPWKLRLSTSINAASGTPFNITTGRDNNGDGNFNDRPAVADPSDPRAVTTPFGVFDPEAINGTAPRNAGTNPATFNVDLNLSRQFRFGPKVTPTDKRYMLTVNARASNLFNHTNPLGLNGVLTSPFFGRANAAGPSRRIEFGVRLSF